MATKTADRAASTIARFKGMGGFHQLFAYGTYEIASALSAADIIQWCVLPKGAIVTGGRLVCDDIDSGTATFELDVGYADNGVETASPQAYLNSGVLNGTAVTNVVPEGGINVPFMGTLKDGLLAAFSAETTIIGTVTAAAAAGGTGTTNVYVNYIVP